MKLLKFFLLFFLILASITFFYFKFFSKSPKTPPLKATPLENIVWCKSGEETMPCFYLSKEGILLDQTPDLKGSLITPIKSQNLPSPDLLNYILAIKEQFKNQAAVMIKEIDLGEVISVLTAEGWKIIFERTSSPEKLTVLLTNILEKEIKEKRNNLEYIDLRLENRAYYKLK